MTDLILVESVSKSYFKRAGNAQTEVEALKNVTMSVGQSSFVSIVGASGCGKTTLLRILSGLSQPSAGRILIQGDEVRGPSNRTATVFQDHSLLPWRTVLANIELGMEAHPHRRSSNERREKANHYADLVGMHGFGNSYPYEISGGMQQRVNLARALAVETPIMLMDEPFAALDSQTRELMQQELLEIWRRDKRTVVFVTHQIDEAIILSDSVVVMGSRPGRIRKIIPIELERPRKLSLKRSPAFTEIADAIWHEIEDDVRASLLFLVDVPKPRSSFPPTVTRVRKQPKKG